MGCISMITYKKWCVLQILGFLCMRMNTLINKFKVIRYFIKNGIFNEESAIEISKFDLNAIEALVHSQLLVQVEGRVYLDKPLYDYRYKEKYIYYGEIILLIILLIFAFHVSYLKTTLFRRWWYEKESTSKITRGYEWRSSKIFRWRLIGYNSKKKEGIYFLDEVCSFMLIM